MIKNSAFFLAYAEYLARTTCSAGADLNVLMSLCNLPQHDEYVYPTPHGHSSIAAPPNDDTVLVVPLPLPLRFFFFFFFFPPAAKRLVPDKDGDNVVAGIDNSAGS